MWEEKHLDSVEKESLCKGFLGLGPKDLHFPVLQKIPEKTRATLVFKNRATFACSGYHGTTTQTHRCGGATSS